MGTPYEATPPPVSIRNLGETPLVWGPHMNTYSVPSPRSVARFAGTFYLLTIVTGIVAQLFISDRLVGTGDAASTAASILANEPLYRLGFTIYLIEMACQVTFTVLFYRLLGEVNRPVAQVALALGVVGCTVKLLSRVFYFTPLLILGGSGFMASFSGDQLAGLARLSLAINYQGAAMALVFFGLSALLNGYLAFRSHFMPRALGVLSMLGGVGWLSFLNPSFGLQVFPIVAAVALLGSISWILWLLIVGVREGDSYGRSS